MTKSKAATKSKAWAPPPDFFNETPEKLEPLRRAAVAATEKALGVRLPASYIALLAVRNGGYIHYTDFPSKEPKKHRLRGSDVPVRGIAGIGNGSRFYDLVKLTASMAARGVDPKRFVALDGEGHYWICFDRENVTAEGEPSIAYVVPPGEGLATTASCTIAPDFATFVRGLRRDEY